MTHAMNRRGLRPVTAGLLLAAAAGALAHAAPVRAQTQTQTQIQDPASAQPADARLALPAVTVTGEPAASLTVPDAAEAAATLAAIPGAVELVPDTAWQDGPATTVRDVLRYVPGVFAQPKWGEDTRLSIRGSGLSRNFHLRGIQLLMDGVPVNVADGGGDFQELDPTAYRYVEVYKGANALRYGANALGGAINFVTPSGHDAPALAGRAEAGSFGFRRLQASVGGVHGAVDGFATGSWLTQNGYREHSEGSATRGSANLGWRIDPDAETRFYLNAGSIAQEIPGSLTKSAALTDPRQAAPNNLRLDYQRNVDSWRVANRTAVDIGDMKVSFGGHLADKHLVHPIFQYLDYRYHDYGAFGRVDTLQDIAGHGNRLTLGLTYAAGWVDNSQYVNLPGGQKGALLSQSKDSSTNWILHGEDSFDLRPDLALVAGLQYVDASRQREDRLATPPDSSGSADYRFLNPKLGLLWQAGPQTELFGNLSRSGEAPTFSELNFTNTALSSLDAQTATTAEIGTRGSRGGISWDLSLYRAWLRNEFQFFDLGGGNYQVVNADRTIHQGAELGMDWTALRGLAAGGSDPDRITLRGAYTFSDFRFDGDSAWGDNQLPGAPRHMLEAELLYHHPLGFQLGPNVEWVPEAYYVDNANSQRTQNYALLGFKASYEIADRLSLYLDARNLLDTAYISSASVVAVANPNSALYEPGNGRAVYGGVRLQW